MKFSCDSCGTKYSIADERVRGRILKIRCAKCQHLVVVREPNEVRAPTEDDSSAVKPPVKEWFVAIDGEPVGPLNQQEVKQRLEEGQIDGETLVWGEGFEEWRQLASVADFGSVESPSIDDTWEALFADTAAMGSPQPSVAVKSAPPEQSTGDTDVKRQRRVFVSYRREDDPYAAGRLVDALAARFGREAVFHDVDSIPIGVDFRRHLTTAVRECAACIVVIGRGWLQATDEKGVRRLDKKSDFVRIEIESALEQGCAVIPVMVMGAKMPAEQDLPDTIRELAYRNGTVVRPDPDFTHDVARLIRGLERTFEG